MPSSGMDRLSNIIGMIYDCVLDPQNWDETLQAIVHEYRFSTCSLIAQELSSGQITKHVTVGFDDIWLHNMGTYESAVLGAWGGAARIANFPLEEPIINSEVTPRSELATNLYYTDILAPRGLIDCVAVGLEKSPVSYAAMALGQHESDGPISERSREGLRLLAPHIRRAVLISQLFESKVAQAATLSETLDAIAPGVVLVDETMAIVHANSAAKKMMRRGAPIVERTGTVGLESPITDTILGDAIGHAACGEKNLERRSIDIPVRTETGSPAVVQVLPLKRRKTKRRLEQRAVAAIFVTDAASTPKLPAEALALLYNLTPAEARIFEQVVEGQSPAAIATALGLSMPTVRTHMSRIFDKTGCRRQADLVALAARIPRVVY